MMPMLPVVEGRRPAETDADVPPWLDLVDVVLVLVALDPVLACWDMTTDDDEVE